MKENQRSKNFVIWGNDRLNRIFHNIKEVWYVISGRLIISIEPEKHAKAEKRRNRIIGSLVALVLLSILLIIGIPWIKYYNTIIKQQISNTDALQFISTFWGAIIGALLAASLTIISTWMIINRSYRVDFHRDRIDHLPVLCLHEIRGAVLDEDGIKLPDGNYSIGRTREYQFFTKFR
jgi:heme/copper-type cytochrome/quinol oxidase subunit 4